MMDIKEAAKLINEYLSLEHNKQTTNGYLEDLLVKAIEKDESWTTEQIYCSVINSVI